MKIPVVSDIIDTFWQSERAADKKMDEYIDYILCRLLDNAKKGYTSLTVDDKEMRSFSITTGRREDRFEKKLHERGLHIEHGRLCNRWTISFPV